MNAYMDRPNDTPQATRANRARAVACLLAIWLMTSILAGCGSSKQPTHWLALPLPRDAVPLASTAQAEPPATLDVTAQRPVLTVRRIALPEYLQSNSVRFRQSDSMLAEWPDARWADRLEVGLTDHLVMRLRRHLPEWTVCERQCPPGAGAISLHVEFSPLDYVRPARELRAEARWQFVQRDQSAAVEGGKASAERVPMHRTSDGMKAFVLRVDNDDAAGQVAAMGELLDDLSADLARAARVWK